ncbi:replication protein A 70 kDa DNA-binding subunit-like [Rhopilema esculentum]|uniref:replication protein A 70 kDa DNA-binding subunit-like n=1 Tax=Rhopilema esculentum TaxID=499914 RepID=UPI0031E3B360
MSMSMLSSGIIKDILVADSDNLPSNPVVQVLGLKKLQSSKGPDRFRVVLSDGVNYYTSAMLGTQLNDMVEADTIEAKCIARLEQYTCNVAQNTRKVIVVLSMKIIKPATEIPGKIGQPVQLSDQITVIEEMAKEMKMQNGTKDQHQSSNQQNQVQPMKSADRGFGNGNANGQPNPYGANKGGGFYGGGPKMQNKPVGAGGMIIHPISSLTPYQNRWTVRARVTNKSSIRTWSNSKGEGKLFNVDLLDETGEIKATGFNDAVDKFHPLLEVGKVYFISRGSLRTANKQYTSLKNDYEMYLNNDSVIEQCTEDVDLPQVQFNFVAISELEKINKDAIVDIIGVVKSAQDVVQITTRNGKQVSKRDINVVDRSEACVNATLWGDQAETFDEHMNQSPVVAVKGAKVSDFGGRSLSVMNSSVFHINPDIPEAHELRGWYDKVGKDAGVKSLSGQRTEGGISGQFKTLAQMKEENLGMGDKPDYFSTRASAIFFRKENCLYKACPSAECNKKVIDEGGEYRCEKCNRLYPEFKYRMILSTNICDSTSSQWITCFQESGEQILGTTADEVGRMRDNDERAFEDLFAEASFRMYNLRLRAKVDTYNDESRLKVICTNLSPVDFCADSQKLLEDIKKLENM